MGRTVVFDLKTVCPDSPVCVAIARKKSKKSRFHVDFFRNLIIILSCMDTKKDKRIVECGSMAEISRQNVVVGAKQLRKALRSGHAQRVYLAKNADPAITEPIEAMCREHSVEYAWVRSMMDLGRACGIEVGAAAAAVVA